MSKIVIKENKKLILKTRKDVDIKNMVVVAPEHYYAIIDRTLFMSDNLRQAFENLIKAIDDENMKEEKN